MSEKREVSSKIQVFTLLVSTKSNYVAYLVIDKETDKETGEVKDKATHIGMASATTEAGVLKIYNF